MATGFEQREQVQFLRADTFFSAMRVSLNKPAASKSASVIVTVEGFRTVIDTVSSGTTGGTMICTRSPVGKMVETIGFSRVTSWRGECGCGRRQRHQILEIEAGFAFPCPSAAPFDADFAGTVDDEFGDARVIEIFA